MHLRNLTTLRSSLTILSAAFLVVTTQGWGCGQWDVYCITQYGDCNDTGEDDGWWAWSGWNCIETCVLYGRYGASYQYSTGTCYCEHISWGAECYSYISAGEYETWMVNPSYGVDPYAEAYVEAWDNYVEDVEEWYDENQDGINDYLQDCWTDGCDTWGELIQKEIQAEVDAAREFWTIFSIIITIVIFGCGILIKCCHMRRKRQQEEANNKTKGDTLSINEEMKEIVEPGNQTDNDEVYKIDFNPPTEPTGGPKVTVIQGPLKNQSTPTRKQTIKKEEAAKEEAAIKENQIFMASLTPAQRKIFAAGMAADSNEV